MNKINRHILLTKLFRKTLIIEIELSKSNHLTKLCIAHNKNLLNLNFSKH